MKLIIGLGNPEEKYSDTRHNIGFEIVNLIQKEWGFSEFEFSNKFNAEISKGFIHLLPLEGEGGRRPDEGKQEIILVRPQTFMNLSGEAVQKILDFYKLTPEGIIVIHDDLDIALGKFKIAADSTSAGHNGVQNIIETLGTQKFKRIRIGIGEEISGAISCRVDAHDFVLGKFSEEELDKLKKISEDILNAIKKLL